MNCLENYIGIKGCGTVTPIGGYINMLPGITLKSVQGIANSEQVTYVNVWKDIQERAWLRFEKDVQNALRSRYAIKTTRGFYNLKTIDRHAEIQPSNNYCGLVIDSGIDENGLFAFDVSTISIDLITAVPGLQVFLFDREGNQLDVLMIDGAVGPNTISVNKRYAASLIFIAVNASGIALKTTTVSNGLEGFYSLMFSSFGECCRPSIHGALASLDAPYEPAVVSGTYGLSAKISPVCDFSSIVCHNKEQFKSAWMNLLGAELMLETLYSERVNRITTIKGEAAADLRDLYTGQYQNDLEEAIQGIRINADDACIECRQMVSRRERLP